MRREWIEIEFLHTILAFCGRSPSMRREWIEIPSVSRQIKYVNLVSLHAEGVD